MEFKDRLVQLRKENNISREELANKLNLSYSAISKYETGTRTPDDDIKKRIAEYFDVSLDYLMGVSNIRNPYKKTSINKIIKSNDVIEKEYKKEIEFLEKFRQEMISRGYDYYKDKTLEELADIVVKHLKIQEILDDNNSKSN